MTKLKIDLDSQEIFLGLLDTLLCRGYFEYQQYLKLGKKLLYAIKIKENNSCIVNLILNNDHLFQEDQRSDLLIIVYHIDSWRTQWDFLYENSHPKLEDEFVFETTIKFPKNSLERLDKYYYKNFNKKFSD
jgi:hypothetical protein